MPTPRQIKAAKLLAENIRKPKPSPIGRVLKEAGYSDTMAETPERVTKSVGFLELVDQFLPDEQVLDVHKDLLKTTRIEHMVFPLATGEDTASTEPVDGETGTLTDTDIRTMIAEIGGKVRKIVRGETARHVYYWVPDAATRKAAVELAYKVKGRITNKVKFDGSIVTNPFGELSPEELRALAKDG